MRWIYMTPISEKEMNEIYGGGKSYWYTTSPYCSYYAYSSNYFAEPFAYAKVVAHKHFCSLCVREKVTFSKYLPWNKG